MIKIFYMKNLCLFFFLLLGATVGSPIYAASCEITNAISPTSVSYDILIGQNQPVNNNTYYNEIYCYEKAEFAPVAYRSSEASRAINSMKYDLGAELQGNIEVILTSMDDPSMRVVVPYNLNNEVMLTNSYLTMLQPKVRYRVEVRANNLYFLSDGKAYPPYRFRQNLYWIENRILAYMNGDLNADDSCQKRSYTTTIEPFEVDFGGIDKKDLDNQREFIRDFSITLHQSKTGCPVEISPTIKMTSSDPIHGNSISLTNSGLYLDFMNSDYTPVEFNSVQNMGVLSENKPLTKGYKVRLRKDKNNNVKYGEFSTVVEYHINYR